MSLHTFEVLNKHCSILSQDTNPVQLFMHQVHAGQRVHAKSWDTACLWGADRLQMRESQTC